MWPSLCEEPIISGFATTDRLTIKFAMKIFDLNIEMDSHADTSVLEFNILVVHDH